jgi:uncharacterized phage protein gp47/JayE
MDRPSFQDLFRIGRDELLARNPRLTAVDREGSDANALVAASAAQAEEVIAQVVAVEAASFLDSATGDDLDRLVFDRYGLVRQPASAALGAVQFSTGAAAAAAFTIPSGTLLQSTDGLQFEATLSVSYPAGSVGPISAPVRSVLAGSSQQAGAGTINRLVAAVAGGPADLAVTNALATAGAADPEPDAQLRDRARRFWSTARRGTLRAIEQAALGVPGVRTATAIEAVDGFGRPARYVYLVISDQYTDQLANLTPPISYQTQAQQLANAVSSALEEARPAGIYVQVQVAQVILQPVVLYLAFVAGSDTESLAVQARAAVVGLVNNLAPGQPLLVSAIQAVLTTIPGVLASVSTVGSPAGDVYPGPGQVLRANLSTVAAGISSTQPLPAAV